MSTLFISDLHLSPNQPELIQVTVDFLAQQAPKIDQLYILGDLFNTWLGDDIVPDEFQPLIDQLTKLHQVGIKSYLMVGNRDFMMGKAFSARCGMTLLPDPTLIKLGTHKVLLMHGDSLCTDDVSYQRYRRWSRNRFIQRCFLMLSANYRQGISDKIKQKSRQQKQHKSAMIMDVNQQEVDRVIAKYQVDYLLHGHTHRPAIHSLGDNQYRIVLGDWQQQPSFIVFDGYQLQLSDPRITNDSDASILNLS
jgi:UDP-2,3-diacylglucosamine hydrolase